ncbi:MAG: hypothetical protein M1453_08090 [Acidobacteria bacterium]|nr:hypothetical protein [Acidobacteriota bacterium]MCL5287937.1 hypothetical protein [Acidobacteriota bacterium]
MSERTELLGAAFHRIGNPFVLCRMVSLRTRQLLGVNAQWDGREAITQALRELASECLEFQLPDDVSCARKDEAEGKKRVQEVQPVAMPLATERTGVETSAK